MRWRLLALLTSAALPLAGQAGGDLARERAEFAAWLAGDALSPYAAVGLQPVGAGLSIGPEPADLPLPGVPHGSITEDGRVVALTTGSGRRVLPRLRAVALGAEARLVVGGVAGRATVAAFSSVRAVHPPAWYPPDAAFRSEVTLERPERRDGFRVLGLDGFETEAQEVGLVRVRVAGTEARLRVYRMGRADDDEAPLQVFFRDATNGHGTYPAGRFVELVSLGGGRYELDLNRARNPFCAYSSVYPCPAPWPGNTIPAAVTAGERYEAAP